jgi:hypothetical protein
LSISCLKFLGFKWSALPEKTLIVDVGGGIGSISLEIAQANPHLRFLIQDKQAVIREGEQVSLVEVVFHRDLTVLVQHWETELPGALAAGRVSFGGQTLFVMARAELTNVQSTTFSGPSPSRMRIYSFSGSLSTTGRTRTLSSAKLRIASFARLTFFIFRILKQLRDAAQMTTKLIVIEHLVPLACGEDETYKHIPGAVPATLPPKPLLPNLGIVNMVPYAVDIQVRRRSRLLGTYY